MSALAQALCLCLVVSGAPQPRVAQRAGDIWYTHEVFHSGTHLLRLSTTDLILDSERFRKERLYAFAEQFADQTCRGRFQLADAERPSWPEIRPTFAKQFVFRCR